MPTVLAEVLGLAFIVAVVALLAVGLAALDRRHVRRGGTPLGFASDRTLEQLHRQQGDATPSHLVGGRVTTLSAGHRPPGVRYGDVFVGDDTQEGDL